jgi:hypothetical protein
MSTKSAAFNCPFPGCNRRHTNKSQLKLHLRNAQADSTDTLHKDPAIWETAKKDGLLDFRLRNLPPKIREQRRKESRAGVYRNHKTDQIRKQKERRQSRQQTLTDLFNSIDQQSDLVEQVGTTAEIAVHTEKLRKNVVDRVWGKTLSLSQFVFDIDHPPESSSEVTVHTFPRFVVYFLPPTQLPSFDKKGRIIDRIPTNKHFRKVSTYIHSDRNPDPTLSEMMKHLSTSFDLHWKEIVEDTEMKTAKLWEDGCEIQFRARGEKYGKMADLYKVCAGLGGGIALSRQGEEFIYWGFVVACDAI